MTNLAQELFTVNVSKLTINQRNQLNAYLTWSIRQHYDALTRILNARKCTIIGTSSQDCSTFFLFLFFILYFTTYQILLLFYTSIARTTKIFFYFLFLFCKNVRDSELIVS